MAEQKENKKVAVFTGVSKGIGLSGAEKLIDLGYNVIGCARSEKKMKELQEKVYIDYILIIYWLFVINDIIYSV